MESFNSSPRGNTYAIQWPWADSHARWNAKSNIYPPTDITTPPVPYSYISLEQEEASRENVPLHCGRVLEVLVHLFISVQRWLFWPLTLQTAPVQKFSRIDKKLSEVRITVPHSWYLSEELIPLSLLNMPCDAQNKLAEKISRLPDDQLPIKKPTLPRIAPSWTITDFVAPRSIILFKIMDVPRSFLSRPELKDHAEFNEVKMALQNPTQWMIPVRELGL